MVTVVLGLSWLVFSSSLQVHANHATDPMSALQGQEGGALSSLQELDGERVLFGLPEISGRILGLRFKVFGLAKP